MCHTNTPPSTTEPLPARRPPYRRLWLAICQILWMFLGSSAFALTAEEQNTIATYEKVAPSVVNITTTACEPEYFFCALPNVEGSGSGIILRPDGTIVTNYHVVAKASSIQVTLSDGRHMEARLIASSPRDDLAIIRIDPGRKPLVPITLGDSDRLDIGEKVLAIGNPFGLGETLTVGAVSMIRRDVKNDGRLFNNLIQTDASINPGNSGGALVNSNGQLIGMNSAIVSPTGASVGIGFAIPVNRIKTVTPGLMISWERWVGWVAAVVLVVWILGRITRASKRLGAR